MKNPVLDRMIREYFRLSVSSIIGAMPFTLQNGTPADATQVMANLTFIISQVNLNAQPVSSSSTIVPQYVSAVGGSANAITLTPTVPIAAYVAGQTYTFLPIAPNTGATTINTSGLGNRNLLYADGSAMTGGELLANQPYQVEDNGSNYVLINSAQATGITNWTPFVTFGGGSTGITYATQTGKACKIGRMVFFAFFVSLTNKGSSTGTAAVNGLPYTVNAGWVGNNAGPLVSANMGFGGGFNVFGYNLGTTSINLLNITSGGAIAGISDASFTNTTQLAGAAAYVT